MHNLHEITFQKHLKEMTILCVEDSKTIQLIYNTTFNIVFKEVLIANNGQEGLDIIKTKPIDIIITDYSMPIMNGIDMIKAIQLLDKEIPIILVTAMESTDVVVQALNNGVHNFLYKPFDIAELNDSVESAAKIVIANTLLTAEKEKLIEQRAYQVYQEDLSFRKELAILRNDFYYQRYIGKRELLVDFSYTPLDILSGDAYSARKLTEDQTFFYIVDGMGKGLSASLSAMLLTSFVNYQIDLSLEKGTPFNLHFIVAQSIQFIQKILLEDEVLSVEFIIIDEKSNEMHYAIYSMPALLLHYEDDTIDHIPSNNPPLSPYNSDINIDSVSLESVQKLLFFSDGLVENSVDDGVYSTYIEQDFKKAFSRNEFKHNFFSRINEQEDDITFIFLHFIPHQNKPKYTKTFTATIDNLTQANEWFENHMNTLNIPNDVLAKTTLAFNELYMNAFEHGSLAIDHLQKEQLIRDDTYMKFLEQQAYNNTKKIQVSISTYHYNTHQEYCLTTIEDEGDGFDTQLLSTIFRDKERFNGKGVLISRKFSDGIYYNEQGNSVLFIHRII